MGDYFLLGVGRAKASIILLILTNDNSMQPVLGICGLVEDKSIEKKGSLCSYMSKEVKSNSFYLLSFSLFLPSFLLFFKDFIYLFLEGGREG